MATVHPYLTFEDNCEEAFNFYKSVFGGEFTYLGRFSEMPPEYPLPENERNKIMHISLPIGNGAILMGSDNSSGSQMKINQGNNFSLSLDCSSEDEANDLFAKLSGGGKVIMPLEKTFWNAYFGMCIDRFGIQWMLNYDYQQG